MPLLNPPSSSAAPKRLPSLPNLPVLPEIHDERTLRIALVTEYYYPHLGGVCEHVHFFAREARRRGHHVDIITSNLPGAVPQPNVIRFGRSQSVYATARRPASRSVSDCGSRCAVCCTAGDTTSFTCTRHSRLSCHCSRSKRRIARSSERFTRTSTSRRSTRSSTIFSRSASTCLPRRSASRIRRPSPSSRISAAPWRIIPNGIDTDVFHPSVAAPPAIRKDVPSILFLGRFDPRNGLSTLIDSFRKVKGKNRAGAARRRRRRTAPRALLQAGERRSRHHVRRRGARGSSELLRAQLHLRLPHHQGVVRDHTARVDGLRDADRLLRHPRFSGRRGERPRGAHDAVRRPRRARRCPRASCSTTRVCASSSA